MISDNMHVSAFGTDGVPELKPLAGMSGGRRLRHASRAAPGALLRVGVIGYGYWGPNIVRNLHGLETAARSSRSATRTRRALDARAAAPIPASTLTTDFSDMSDVARHRCRRGRHAGLDALRAGQGRAGERQARLRREAVHVDVRAGRGAHRAGRAQEPQDHGGPHVSVQRRRQEDPRARRQRHARAALLLRLDAREPRPVPARRQRRLGSRAARPLDHGPHHHREARSRRRDGRQPPERPCGHGVHHHLLSQATSSRTSTSTGCRRSRCGRR